MSFGRRSIGVVDGEKLLHGLGVALGCGLGEGIVLDAVALPVLAHFTFRADITQVGHRGVESDAAGMHATALAQGELHLPPFASIDTFELEDFARFHLCDDRRTRVCGRPDVGEAVWVVDFPANPVLNTTKQVVGKQRRRERIGVS